MDHFALRLILLFIIAALFSLQPLRSQERGSVSPTSLSDSFVSDTSMSDTSMIDTTAVDSGAIALDDSVSGPSTTDDGSVAPVPFDGYDPMRSQWQWERAAVVGGLLGATVTGIHLYQKNAWWSGDRRSFHFQDDWEYALNVDKAGHFYGGALGAFLGRTSLEWSGASRSTALWGGSLMGALFELYVEFEDGFAKDWGFSPGDAYADLAGATWPLLQEYIPGFEHLHPKFSYWPSKALREGNHDGNMIDDYEGQTFWMGVHVHGLLPRSLKPYWPEWLGIAVGMAVRNMPLKVGGEVIYGNPQERNILIALDYDVTKIIPSGSWLLEALKEGLNFIHFPAPAIRISPNHVSYGLYF